MKGNGEECKSCNKDKKERERKEKSLYVSQTVKSNLSIYKYYFICPKIFVCLFRKNVLKPIIFYM
jgi:hypothetical protein